MVGRSEKAPLAFDKHGAECDATRQPAGVCHQTHHAGELHWSEQLSLMRKKRTWCYGLKSKHMFK